LKKPNAARVTSGQRCSEIEFAEFAAHHLSNGKMRFQSFFILMTFQPFDVASS